MPELADHHLRSTHAGTEDGLLDEEGEPAVALAQDPLALHPWRHRIVDVAR